MRALCNGAVMPELRQALLWCEDCGPLPVLRSMLYDESHA